MALSIHTHRSTHLAAVERWCEQRPHSQLETICDPDDLETDPRRSSREDDGDTFLAVVATSSYSTAIMTSVDLIIAVAGCPTSR